MPSRKIAVAGAGIGGLAFAALAARSGNDVTVFERFETPQPLGSGLVVQPVGQVVLQAAGAGTAAMALGQRIDRMLGHETDRGRRVLDVAYDPRGHRFGLAMHRAALFQVLYDAALAAGVQVVPGREVTGRDGQRLEFKCGGRAGPFDLIVDALGAHSALSPLRARDLRYGAIWGTVAWPDGTGLPADQLTQRYQRAEKMAGVLPIGRLPGAVAPLAAVFWSLPVTRYPAWRDRPLDAWKDEATQLWPDYAPFLEGITGHSDMTMAAYSHGTLRTPAASGLAHIGDAAHRASPQLGQGANMALLDAWALWRALRVHDLDDALKSYVRARRWHVWTYQAMSAAFTPQYQSGSHLAAAVRDYALAPLSRAPPVPRILSRLVCGDLLPPAAGLSDEG